MPLTLCPDCGHELNYDRTGAKKYSPSFRGTLVVQLVRVAFCGFCEFIVEF